VVSSQNQVGSLSQFVAVNVTNPYLLQAFNLYHAIPVKSLRPILTGRIVDSSPSALQVEYGDLKFVFIYRFGAIVFFNMDTKEVEEELSRIRGILGPDLDDKTSETFHIKIGDQDRFEFDYAELRSINIKTIGMIALTVGQSAALETYEIHSDRMLHNSANFMQRLAKVGSVPLRGKILLKFIGSAAGTRQEIVANLAILDPPEEAWLSHEMQKIFKETQQCFDIDVRFRALDRKLTLVQDNLEILANLVTNRRAAILEILIVGLIALELILAVFK